MICYFKMANAFAFYLEAARDLGAVPLLTTQRWEDEIIIDLPYTRIILTPGRNLEKEGGRRKANGATGTDGTYNGTETENEYRNQAISSPARGHSRN